MLVKCIDGREYHVLVKEKEVLIMDDSANLGSISLGAFLFGLKVGFFVEMT